jgi:hypothetical protein
LRIGQLGCGFWRAERGELMVNRGDLYGSCVVIFVGEKFSTFLKYISIEPKAWMKAYRR